MTDKCIERLCNKLAGMIDKAELTCEKFNDANRKEYVWYHTGRKDGLCAALALLRDEVEYLRFATK